MNVITPKQSEDIERDVFRQILALDDLANSFAPPWGALARDRMRHLCRERTKIYFRSAK